MLPSGLVCEHSFQTFVDKNFLIRGYQKVDFELSKMEFYEGKSQDENTSKENIIEFTATPIFQEIITLLRETVDDKNVLGCAILAINGKVLYSSLPQNTLFNTIKEFEVRNENKLVPINSMYLELRDGLKICSRYIELFENNFILILVFSKNVKLGMGKLMLRELSKKISLIR
ncbi:MAG: hypothetical protein P8Y70_08025 [Candidatus Lokiarchaeota archaeon]